MSAWRSIIKQFALTATKPNSYADQINRFHLPLPFFCSFVTKYFITQGWNNPFRLKKIIVINLFYNNIVIGGKIWSQQRFTISKCTNLVPINLALNNGGLCDLESPRWFCMLTALWAIKATCNKFYKLQSVEDSHSDNTKTHGADQSSYTSP